MTIKEFSADSTADDFLADRNLTGKRVLITGGVSGLGKALASSFLRKGAELILPVRNWASGDVDKKALFESVGSSSIEWVDLDLSDFDSVRRGADQILQTDKPIDIQINNAGIMACPLTRNEQGYEIQFCTNHLGHFLLTGLLLPLLRKSSNARIISVSSLAHRLSPIVFDDIHFHSRPYDKWQAYAQSKTANALFAVGLQRRYGPGMDAFAVHPGGVWTRLQRDMNASDFRALGWIDENGEKRSGFKTPEQGAATAAWAATATELAGKGGCYLENCSISHPADAGNRMSGYAEHIVDASAAELLWTMSEECVDFSYPA